jgi:uncharacterized protein (DUF1778 family)
MDTDTHLSAHLNLRLSPAQLALVDAALAKTWHRKRTDFAREAILMAARKVLGISETARKPRKSAA